MDPFDEKLEAAQFRYDMHYDQPEDKEYTDDVPDVFNYEDESKADDKRRGME